MFVNVCRVQAPEMVFQPSLDHEAPEGFYNMVEGLLDDIFHFASLIPRVATHLEAQDYRTDLDEVRPLSLSNTHTRPILAHS